MKDTTKSNGLPGTARMEIALAQLVPDPDNRRVVEDENFQGFVDSIRVFGVIQALVVTARDDGRYDVKDGHRRCRGAELAGRPTVPCDVLPAHVDARQAREMSIVLEQHREPHSALEVARRLRQLKNEHAMSAEQISGRTGLAPERVRAYLSLFGGSDLLIRFFEDKDVPVFVAVEFLRYERERGEAAARKLVKAYAERTMTLREITALRRHHEKGQASNEAGATKGPGRGRSGFAGRVRAAFARDAVAARTELETIAAELGFRLSPVGESDRGA